MEQVSSLKTGVKYKDTPIGKIPVDWEVLKLNNIGELKGGNGFSEKYQGHRDLKYLFIKVSDMNLPCNDIYIRNSINTIDDELKEILKCNIFPRDTIVFAKVGAALLLNRRRIITKESAIDNNMMGLIVKKGYYPKFYYYILQTIDFAKYVFSGALPSVNQKIIGDIDLVSPPLNEQKGIAEILTTVDEGIEKTAQVIEKIKELKKGLMQRLFTQGIGHKRFKKTEIGEIPAEWEVVPLSKTLIGHKSRYGVYKERRLYGEGTQILKIGDVFQKDFYSGEKTQRLMLSEKELISNEVFPNDILMAVASVKLEGVGEAMYVLRLNEKTAFDHNLANIRTDHNKCNPKFLFYTLKSRIIRKRIESLCTKVGTTFLKASEIDKFLIPVPPLNEQHQIAEILFELDAQIEKESNHKEQLETLKKGLMQVLLTGKLRVAV